MALAPSEAMPSAPTWLIPTPCPHPEPSKVNDTGTAATVAWWTAARALRPVRSVRADATVACAAAARPGPPVEDGGGPVAGTVTVASGTGAPEEACAAWSVPAFAARAHGVATPTRRPPASAAIAARRR